MGCRIPNRWFMDAYVFSLFLYLLHSHSHTLLQDHPFAKKKESKERERKKFSSLKIRENQQKSHTHRESAQSLQQKFDFALLCFALLYFNLKVCSMGFSVCLYTSTYISFQSLLSLCVLRSFRFMCVCKTFTIWFR